MYALPALQDTQKDASHLAIVICVTKLNGGKGTLGTKQEFNKQSISTEMRRDGNVTKVSNDRANIAHKADLAAVVIDVCFRG